MLLKNWRNEMGWNRRTMPWGKCICPWTAWCWLPRCSPRAHTLTSGISDDLRPNLLSRRCSEKKSYQNVKQYGFKWQLNVLLCNRRFYHIWLINPWTADRLSALNVWTPLVIAGSEGWSSGTASFFSQAFHDFSELAKGQMQEFHV